MGNEWRDFIFHSEWFHDEDTTQDHTQGHDSDSTIFQPRSEKE